MKTIVCKKEYTLELKPEVVTYIGIVDGKKVFQNWHSQYAFETEDEFEIGKDYEMRVRNSDQG